MCVTTRWIVVRVKCVLVGLDTDMNTYFTVYSNMYIRIYSCGHKNSIVAEHNSFYRKTYYISKSNIKINICMCLCMYIAINLDVYVEEVITKLCWPTIYGQSYNYFYEFSCMSRIPCRLGFSFDLYFIYLYVCIYCIYI